jgi:hypothetical protein
MAKYTIKPIQLTALILVIFVLIPLATVYTARAAETSTNLKLNLTFQANNGTIINSTQLTFAPFDLIQLTANITNGNQTIPQSTVVFSVKGPSSASYPTEIIRSAETDKTGSANITFRIPIEQTEKVVIGIWQVYANVKTSNGTLQQNASFQVAWPIQNVAINFYDTQGRSQSGFNPNDTVKAVIAFNSDKAQTERINFSVQDTSGNILTNQAQDISANTTDKNEVTYEFKIPESAPLGLASANFSIYSEAYQNVSIPAAQNKIAYFAVGNYTMTPPDQTSPTPTPTPSVENSLSLFSWLIVATGFFTFTTLVLFLKRKPLQKMGKITPLPTGQSIQNPDITPEKIKQSSALSENTLKTSLTQIQAIVDQNMKSNEEVTTETKSQFAKQQEATITHLSSIAVTAKKIQELQAALKIEKDQLGKDIISLNQTIGEQENIIRSYYDTLRNEIKKVETLLTDTSPPKQDDKETQQKPD